MLSNSVSFKKVTKKYEFRGEIFKWMSLLHRLKNGQFRSPLVDNEHIALKDIDLEVKQGEKVGLLGHNGSGKSTLLKLIQGVTYPTSGQIDIKGNVGGLIELSAGFQPELTGLENIYLNLSLQGWSRKQIKENIESIVDIAEVSKFIDVPIKKYSSGMKVRLGFAVAMLHSPDIILLDEVLAVGDQRFKEKCYSILQDYMCGKTVFFVSHSLGTVRRVCERVVVLDRGQIVCDDKCEKGITFYKELVKSTSREVERVIVPSNLRRGKSIKPYIEVDNIKFSTNDGIERDSFKLNELIRVSCVIRIQRIKKPSVGKFKLRVLQNKIGNITETVSGIEFQKELSPDEDIKVIKFSFLSTSLYPGTYRLELSPSIENQPATMALSIFSQAFSVEGERREGCFGAIDLKFDIPDKKPKDQKVIPSRAPGKSEVSTTGYL